VVHPDYPAPAYGLFAPLFLRRRPLTAGERRSVRAAANRHQLRLPAVVFGEQVWLLWAGVGELVGAGLCLEAGDRSRRRGQARSEPGGAPDRGGG
jgi:hypothetical protein